MCFGGFELCFFQRTLRLEKAKIDINKEHVGIAEEWIEEKRDVGDNYFVAPCNLGCYGYFCRYCFSNLWHQQSLT
jgi:hypothetical protein